MNECIKLIIGLHKTLGISIQVNEFIFIFLISVNRKLLFLTSYLLLVMSKQNLMMRQIKNN